MLSAGYFGGLSIGLKSLMRDIGVLDAKDLADAREHILFALWVTLDVLEPKPDGGAEVDMDDARNAAREARALALDAHRMILDRLDLLAGNGSVLAGDILEGHAILESRGGPIMEDMFDAGRQPPRDA